MHDSIDLGTYFTHVTKTLSQFSEDIATDNTGDMVNQLKENPVSSFFHIVITHRNRPNGSIEDVTERLGLDLDPGDS